MPSSLFCKLIGAEIQLLKLPTNATELALGAANPKSTCLLAGRFSFASVESGEDADLRFSGVLAQEVDAERFFLADVRGLAGLITWLIAIVSFG